MAKLSSERGAVLGEYVVAVAILLAIFVLGGIALQVAARAGAERSINTVREMVPCDETAGGRLSSNRGECL